MSLVSSLLGAIVRLDGDSLVLHVGEKPYVVTSSSAMNAFRGPLAWGQVELSSRSLTIDAINGMLDQLLSSEQRNVLNELGAVEGELPATDDLPTFTLIAARGGDDIWLEIRPVKPRRIVVPEPEPVAEPEPQPAVSAPEPTVARTLEQAPIDAPLPQPMAHVATPAPAAAPASFELVPDIEQEQPDEREVLEMLASAGLLDQSLSAISISSESEDEAPVLEWDAAETGEELELELEVPQVSQVPEVPGVPEVAARVDLSAAEETPAMAEAPVIEVAPAIEEAPTIEEAPAIEEEPAVAEAPAVQETPAIEEAPGIEEAPAVAEVPPVEEEPEVSELPVVEEVLAIADAPAVEPTPAIEDEPTSAEVAAAEDVTPAAEAVAAAEVAAPPEPVAIPAAAVAGPEPPPAVEIEPVEPEPATPLAEVASEAPVAEEILTPAFAALVAAAEPPHEEPAHVEPAIEPAAAEPVMEPAAVAPPSEPVQAAPEMEPAAVPVMEPAAAERVMEPVAAATEAREPEPVPDIPAAPELEMPAAAAPAPAFEPDIARPAAVVLPLSRGLREQPSVSAPVPVSAPDLERLLRVAAARGASGLYLVAQSQPVVRVDGEMQQLDDEERLTAAEIEAFMLALAPEPTREAVRTGATSEWFRDVPDIGRVRCLSFRDHRGPGVIVRMLPARAISVEQLGLSKEIQSLCGQPDGLVLIAGPRASGKSTLIAAFVELVNRTRADHVIMIERQISFVHESRRSFVSQREVRGDADEIAAAVRGAQREDPDVLVIEELRSADVIAAAVEAAESGRLVFAGLRAPATVPAVERLVDQCPAERRPQILTSLASSLRAVVGQVLLRKRGGGRIAARELLLNTPAAAALIGDGKLFQLPAALESGRKLGSVALNDALAALVRDGIVDPGEAWRKAYDREGLLTLLKREGIDTSFVERLA